MWYLKSKRIKIIKISKSYTDFLRNNIERMIPEEHLGADNLPRPFIGIFISNGNHDYVIPLTSPKAKHRRMRNGLDFHKINGGVYGAINFNNMFPIIDDPSIYQVINTSINGIEDENELRYIYLLRNQLTWLNIRRNRDTILRKADTLYTKYVDGSLNEGIKARCCDFVKLEREYRNYLSQ